MAKGDTVKEGRIRDYKRERELAIKRGETASSSNPNPNAGDNVRHKARRLKEKQLGRKLPTSVHVDHKKRIKEGGSNELSNLRVVPASKNLAGGGQKKRKRLPVSRQRTE